MDQVFTIREGEWQIRIGDEVLPTIWNSKGAALAGLEVERRRRAGHSMPDHTDLQRQAITFNDLFQDMIAGLNADLETGTHHANNRSAAAFAARYPRLRIAMDAMSDALIISLPEDY